MSPGKKHSPLWEPGSPVWLAPAAMAGAVMLAAYIGVESVARSAAGLILAQVVRRAIIDPWRKSRAKGPRHPGGAAGAGDDANTD